MQTLDKVKRRTAPTRASEQHTGQFCCERNEEEPKKGERVRECDELETRTFRSTQFPFSYYSYASTHTIYLSRESTAKCVWACGSDPISICSYVGCNSMWKLCMWRSINSKAKNVLFYYGNRTLIQFLGALPRVCVYGTSFFLSPWPHIRLHFPMLAFSRSREFLFFISRRISIYR